MSQQLRYPSSAVVTVSAVGTNNAAAPSTSIQIAGQDGSNFLRPLLTDSSGHLIVAPLTSSSVVKAQLQDNSGAAILLGQALMAGSLPVAIASNQSTLAISAASLPLPTGASTEATLSAMSAKLPAALGAQLIANSLSVNIASNQTIPVSASSLPLPAGAATSALQTQMSGQLPTTLGQKTSANSLAVTLASDQSAVPVSQSGTWNITNISGTVSLPTGASTEATLSSLNGKVTACNTGAVVVSSSALPTGAATETTLAAMSAKLPAALGQTTMAASVSVAIASNQSSVPVSVSSIAAPTGRAKANTPTYLDYTSTSVTTAAYTQLIASTTSQANLVEIFDSSGQGMILAVGGAGSEVDQLFIFPGGNGPVQLQIAASSRVSIKAKTATASSGFIMLNLYT